MKPIFMLGVTVLWLPFATAQALRDPTIPPVEAGLQPAATSDESATPAALMEREGMAVVVRDGKSYVMRGSHLIAPGAMVDGKRLEKITETEIWLRDGKQRVKVPRFMPEIQIRPASP
jgi:hypothetical protein